MFIDPNWFRASEWLTETTRRANADSHVALSILGAPLRRGSITPGRCDLAPQAIRAATARFSVYDLEDERELTILNVRDCGDANVAELSPAEAFATLSEAAREALSKAHALVILGGDNSVTRAGVHAMTNAETTLARCGLLTLDAHFDLRDTREGLTNGNPVRALLEDGLPGANVVQVGIQSFANSRRYHEVAKDAGIRIIAAGEVHRRGVEDAMSDALARLSTRVDAIYFDLDLDVMDRAFAPATPGSRPGGLTPHDVRRAARICGSHAKVRAMDLVEIDPTKDINDITSMTAAACLLEFASGAMKRFSQ